MSTAAKTRLRKNRKKTARAAAPRKKPQLHREQAAPRAPEWAQSAVFNHARMLAWEGTAEPLQATNLFPPSCPLLDSLQLETRGGELQWADSIHPLDQNRVTQAFSKLATIPFVIEYRLVSANGEFFWVQHTVVAAERKGRKGRLSLIKGFVRDIQAEKELELESLRISEREQNRIGQDLHDDLCQVLAGVSCLMRVAEGRLAAKVPEEVPGISELNQQIIEAMHRTRALTHGLFPGKIQIADVRGALLELASQVKARFQVEVKTEFSGRFPHHNTDQIIQIYRLAQEAISNAIKHGRATSIDVRLAAENANMSLSIIDNGTGLSQDEPAENGVGQHIMKYRTRTLGGELSIRNAPGRGVIVSLTYPFLH